MPERYVAIRDAQVKKGKTLKQAKTSAAKIFNATRKKGEKPVTGKSEQQRSTAGANE